MGSKLHLYSSGISIIDKVWGGLYKGATYVLIGSHNSGRTLLALQYTKTLCITGTSLFIFYFYETYRIIYSCCYDRF